MPKSNLNHSASEEWRPIPGYEGRYEISSHGRVKSIAREYACMGNRVCRVDEKIMRSYLHYRGYSVVWLRTPGTNKKFFLHRLVAEAFLPNPQNLPVVNHIDCNKLNCHVSNLEWMSFSENTCYYYSKKKELEADEIPF